MIIMSSLFILIVFFGKTLYPLIYSVETSLWLFESSYFIFPWESLCVMLFRQVYFALRNSRQSELQEDDMESNCDSTFDPYNLIYRSSSSGSKYRSVNIGKIGSILSES